MRALIAPDAFKGTVSAVQACEIIATAFEAQGIGCVRTPIADGGDGTLEVLLRHGFTAMPVEVVDAAGRARRARIGVRGATAVIELAEICGLVTVADLPLDAWHRTTLGMGMAAHAAIAAGCTDLILALGGSASVDGGIGLLTGLGFAILDADGAPVSPDLAGMLHAERIVPPDLPGVHWRLLVDVTTPLAGRESTAMVFGAQKGLDARERIDGDAALRHWAAVLERECGVDVREVPGGGAAGGVAAGAHAVLGAAITSGAAAVLEIMRVSDLMAGCDAVVTGEGAFDAQSLLGKGTGAVIALARTMGLPAYVIAGSAAADAAAMSGVAGVRTCADAAGSAEASAADPARWLTAAATGLAIEITAGSAGD